MTQIDFTKMQGLGNDFILVDDSSLSRDVDYAILSKRLCDRHFGIGADGLIIVNPREVSYQTDVAWRIFNSDGSEPQMCGNGIRCFAKYVFDKKIVSKKCFTIHTLAGVIKPDIADSGLVTVDMGEPILTPEKIPVKIKQKPVLNYPLKVLDREFKINCVSMGNPHCVIFVDEAIEISKYGPLIEIFDIFPEKTNVEFVRVLSKEHIKVDVWERGCGITLACGTGACACVVAAVLNGFTENKTKVSLPGGDLIINFDRDSNHIFMSGPAEYSFHGTVCL